MQIADGWATEYNRKNFRVVLEDQDWADLLIDAGVPPGTNIPLDAKYQMLKLQAAVYSLQSMAEYLSADPDRTELADVTAELGQKKEQLAQWKQSLAMKFGS